MYEGAADRLRHDPRRDPRRGPREARAPAPRRPGRVDPGGRGAEPGPQLLREQLPRPELAPARPRGGARGARRVRLRPLERALHLRHAGRAQEARVGARRAFSAWRTPSSTRRASTRTAASSRRCSTSATPSSATRSTTRRSSTASASAAPSATAIAHGDMAALEAALEEDAGQAPAHDRDRRRLLDGRRPRAARAHLRSRRALPRARHGRRQPRDRLRRQDRTRVDRALRRHGARRHRDVDARQGARRRGGRLHGVAARDRRAAAAALAARTSSRTASRPAIVGASLAVLELLDSVEHGRAALADRCSTTPGASARA